MSASLGINLLALMLPMVILQVYDRIIPNRATDTFAFLMAGMVVVILIDTALKVFRSLMSMANNFDPPSANKIDPPGATKNQLSRLCFSR